MCRCNLQRGFNLFHICHLITRPDPPLEPYLAQASWVAGRRLCGRDLGPRTGYMVLNLANEIKRGCHMGSAISARSEHSSTKGMLSRFDPYRWRIESNDSNSSNAVATLTTSPSNSTQRARVSKPRLKNEAASDRSAPTQTISSTSSSRPCSASSVRFLSHSFPPSHFQSYNLHHEKKKHSPKNFSTLCKLTPHPATALDVILCLCTAMVLKRRAENERYRHIDENNRHDRF